MKTSFVPNNKGLSAIEIVFAVFITAVVLLTMNLFVNQMNPDNKKLSDNSDSVRKSNESIDIINNSIHGKRP